MAVATVTYRPSIHTHRVEGKYVCDGTPSATKILVGFVPSKVVIVNAEDKDAGAVWTSDMTDAHAMDEDGTAITSNGITPVDDEDGQGFQVGTDSNIQEASKTFSFEAFR